MMIKCLDHLLITVSDMEKTIRFYTEILGMKLQIFGAGRKALQFVSKKINLHQLGPEFKPMPRTLA